MPLCYKALSNAYRASHKWPNDSSCSKLEAGVVRTIFMVQPNLY